MKQKKSYSLLYIGLLNSFDMDITIFSIMYACTRSGYLLTLYQDVNNTGIVINNNIHKNYNN